MGQLKIQELRTESERQLGPRFDIRQFHDVVLGAAPSDVLGRHVNAWIGQGPHGGVGRGQCDEQPASLLSLILSRAPPAKLALA